jgi:RNA polymerase sigma-70 factor (ECF subfamily)
MGPCATTTVADPAVQAIIAGQARRLIGRAGLTAADRADIRQDLTVALIEALPAFDPARSPLAAFACLVVGRAGSNILRHRRAAKRSPPGGAAGPSTDAAGADRRADGDARLADLRADVTAVLAALPAADRDLATALMTDTVSGVARARGVPRARVRDQAAGLRGRFRRGDLEKYL